MKIKKEKPKLYKIMDASLISKYKASSPLIRKKKNKSTRSGDLWIGKFSQRIYKI